MRIDERLQVIREALDESGNIRVEAIERFGGQAFQIDNWRQLRPALEELLRQNWIPNQDLVRDFVEVESSGNTPLLEVRRYHEFDSAIKQLNPSIPIVVGTMSSLATERDPGVIFVEIGDVATPEELNTSITEITELFNILSGDRSFRFAGFAHGSEWLSWIPLSELTGVAANLAILVAQVWFNMLAERSTERLLQEARAWNRANNGDDSDLSDELIENFRAEMVKDDLAPYWKAIEESLGEMPEAQRNQVLNRIRIGAEKARQQMDRGRTFEVSLNAPSITVNGDNNSPAITINGDIILNIAGREPLQLPSGNDSE